MSRVSLLAEIDTTSIQTNRKSNFFDLKIGEQAEIRIIGDPHVFVEYNSKYDEMGTFPDASENPSVVRYGVKGVEDQYSKAGYKGRVKAAFNILVRQEDGTNAHKIWTVSSTLIEKLRALEDQLQEDHDEPVPLGTSKARWIKVKVSAGKPDKKGNVNREWAFTLRSEAKSPKITKADVAVLREASPKDFDAKALMEADDDPQPEWFYLGAPLAKIFAPRKPKDDDAKAKESEMSADELSLDDDEDEAPKKPKAKVEEKPKKAKPAPVVEDDDDEEEEEFPNLDDWEDED